MDDRYPDFWAESNRPRRPRHDPFRVRLVVLLVVAALLTPIALLMRRNDGDVVTTSGLPGAAVALEPVLGSTATTAAPVAIPTPETVAAGTLPPAAGSVSTASANAASTGDGSGAAVAAADPGAGTLPLTVGTLPAPVPTRPRAESSASSGSSGSSGSSSSGEGDGTSSGASEPAAPAQPQRAPSPDTAGTSGPKATPAPAPPRTEPPASKAAPPPPPPNSTSAQVEALIRKVFPDDQEEKALAIAWRESRHNPSAYNGWCCFGLFQIYFDANAKFLATLGVTAAAQLYDPAVNTAVAFAMFQRSGWGPWGG